ncbi:MAG: hypothetical protein CMM53_01340 [Rhodospirillaceae bacterium]|nr:hypothetical protein [Rhodospirillaceae bacterium]
MCAKLRVLIVILFGVFVLAGCKADKAEVTLYTSDIEDAVAGKVVEVPVKATFRIMGKDKKNLLGKSVAVAKKYLSKGSKFTRSKGQFGENLVIETKIPMGKIGPLKNSLKTMGQRLAAVVINSSGKRLDFMISKRGRLALNKELRKINYMLSLDKVIKSAMYRVISDSRKKYKVTAYAVWVSKKPYLSYTKILNRRDEAVLTFKGGSDSIYSQLRHFIIVK